MVESQCAVRAQKDGFDWTDDAVRILRDMWGAGNSSGRIATALGCTRSAVIGKITRLKLTRQPGIRAASAGDRGGGIIQRIRSRAQAPAPKKQRWFKRAKSAQSLGGVEPDPVPLLDLQHHHCRYPLGDPLDLETFRFCGAQRRTQSYCAHHFAICGGKR